MVVRQRTASACRRTTASLQGLRPKCLVAGFVRSTYRLLAEDEDQTQSLASERVAIEVNATGDSSMYITKEA